MSEQKTISVELPLAELANIHLGHQGSVMQLSFSLPGDRELNIYRRLEIRVVNDSNVQFTHYDKGCFIEQSTLPITALFDWLSMLVDAFDKSNSSRDAS